MNMSTGRSAASSPAVNGDATPPGLPRCFQPAEPESVTYAELIVAAADRPVFVTHLAAAAAALRGVGLVAVARPEGGAWTPEALAPFARRVVILLDLDPYGWRDRLRTDRSALERVAVSVASWTPAEMLDRTVPPAGLEAWLASLDRAGPLTVDELVEGRALVESVAGDDPVVVVASEECDDDDDDVGPDLLDDDEETDWPAAPDPAVYHGPIGEFVRSVAPYTEADPIGILLTCMVGFGNVVGREPGYPVDRHNRHGANEFVVLAGPSATGRKGTAVNTSRGLMRLVDPEHDAERVKSGLSSGEGLAWHVRDPVESMVPVKEGGRVARHQREITDVGVQDKRLLCVEPEFGRTLKAAGREGCTLTAAVRDAFDGVPFGSMTKANAVKATNSHISIIGCITKEEWDRRVTEEDMSNGFCNRFLLAAVRRANRLPFGDDGAMPEATEFAVRLQMAVNHARRVGDVGWSPEARPIWGRAYDRLTAERPGRYGALTSRAEAHVIRLSLIFALADCASSIAPAHLRAALELWSYCERTARWLAGDQTGDSVADKVLDLLRQTPGEWVRRSDVRRVVLNNRGSRAALDLPLGRLLRWGLAERRREKTAGRPVEFWRAVPRSLSSQSSLSPPGGAASASAAPLKELQEYKEQAPSGNGRVSGSI